MITFLYTLSEATEGFHGEINGLLFGSYAWSEYSLIRQFKHSSCGIC